MATEGTEIPAFEDALQERGHVPSAAPAPLRVPVRMTGEGAGPTPDRDRRREDNNAGETPALQGPPRPLCPLYPREDKNAGETPALQERSAPDSVRRSQGNVRGAGDPGTGSSVSPGRSAGIARTPTIQPPKGVGQTLHPSPQIAGFKSTPGRLRRPPPPAGDTRRGKNPPPAAGDRRGGKNPSPATNGDLFQAPSPARLRVPVRTGGQPQGAAPTRGSGWAIPNATTLSPHSCSP